MDKLYLSLLIVGLNFTNALPSTQDNQTFVTEEAVDVGSMKPTQVRSISDEKTNHLEPFSSANSRLLEAELHFKVLVPKKTRISLKSKDIDIETFLTLQVTNISQKPIKFVTGIEFIEMKGESEDGKPVEMQSQNAYGRFNTSRPINNVPQLLPGQSREYNVNVGFYKRENRIILKAYEELKTWDFIISKAGKYCIKIKTVLQIYPDVNKETDTLFTDFLSVA